MVSGFFLELSGTVGVLHIAEVSVNRRTGISYIFLLLCRTVHPFVTDFVTAVQCFLLLSNNYTGVRGFSLVNIHLPGYDTV